ncbi:permease prefix domain 1-containing protein [Neobacillus sp. OS1-2]|uniref:permease prefix domain 1-containing protein n=1 Tax=Neobacillus sp. OS1-2 TaxID=3070680 RepID=UPI0027DED1BD|nr:permease prefix domain 1-containing protein [Neobacillus sp. OS1-2]WML41469.1 permease prefix domain 1-containing protein [Neobacillus sp. OS1-2]
MNELERYLQQILADLPQVEREEMHEELYAHLVEHMNDLMSNGYSEKEAAHLVIQSFGNEQSLNQELKRAMFPWLKIARFVWSVFFVTAFLCLVSYFSMEFYHPEFANTLPVESVVGGFFIVLFVAGAAEAIYEGLNQQFNLKWLRNTWLLFFVPALIVGAIQSRSLINHPDQYPDGLWLDLFAIPIGAFAYLLARQIFTLLFLNKKRPKDKRRTLIR